MKKVFTCQGIMKSTTTKCSDLDLIDIQFINSDYEGFYVSCIPITLAGLLEIDVGYTYEIEVCPEIETEITYRYTVVNKTLTEYPIDPNKPKYNYSVSNKYTDFNSNLTRFYSDFEFLDNEEFEYGDELKLSIKKVK